ncbi:uncharacterized protein LOC133185994 [Saccostrea echinata]|uniref:uncharacterized protein LOC133185994 n=1 Tax=Saccostrea echinata TaxID=191078 RepID=UPI002A8390DE|nr:uncharacterized protein LOC133185994 [Saccostrea echinata]
MTVGKKNGSYQFSYLWKACDWLMGFKECVDVRRIVEETWLKVTNQEYTFERKAIGSFGDGIEYRRNNIDDLVIFRNTCVLAEDDQWNPSIEKETVFLAEYTGTGYCMLKYISGPVFSGELFYANKERHVYFSSSLFVKKCLELSSSNSCSEGPVIVAGGQRTVCALPVIGWPPAAKEWKTRDRCRYWPTPETIKKVIQDGCQCVPTGHPSSDTKIHEWQLCFSVAECTLVHSMDHATFTLYQIIRIFIHERLNSFEGCDDFISSYMIRTLMFWVCEDKLPNFVSGGNLKESIQTCLSQLEEWIRKEFVPHYFIPERNLIERKLRPLQKAFILERLLTLRSELLTEVLSCPSFEGVKNDVSADPPKSVDVLDLSPEDLQARCEFVFFEYIGDSYFSAMCWSRAQLFMQNVEKALDSDTLSDIQRDTLKQMYYKLVNAAGKIAYRIVQNSHTNRRRYLMLCLSEAFLRIGCASDVTSGRLSLASFYFCTDKIRRCIMVTNLALQNILPFTVYLRDFRHVSNNTGRRELYQSAISSDDLPLSEKMKRGCVVDIEIIRSSYLWPKAMELEMQIHDLHTRLIKVPALVYLHFLRFLSFEMSNSIEMKMEALTNLSAIVYDDEHNNGSFLTYNIIGICQQRAGNYSEAVEMFCESVKAAKGCDWINKNKNPGLLRIGILLNKLLREERH